MFDIPSNPKIEKCILTKETVVDLAKPEIIINENKDLLALIANTLLEEETITKEEIDYLVEHGHLPEEKSTEESKEDNTKETNKKNKKEVKKEDTKSK